MEQLAKLTSFVKWAGGKKQLLERLKARMPKTYGCYYEPFIGGGALLLDVQPSLAVINDVNLQLINVYRELKTNAEEVIAILRTFDSEPCNTEHYLKMRTEYNRHISEHVLNAKCAALMIWINKHCFNGLYRVNSKGLFNVPFNNKIQGVSMNETNLRNIASYLSSNDIAIHDGDFEVACNMVKPNDFVYFDSPYIPVSMTANFTDYTKDGFQYKDHKRLANLFKELDKKGVQLMLSNHDVDAVYELYAGFRIERVDVKRAINRDASKRVGKEVIITNY